MRNRAEAGFTLIEVVIAMGILALYIFTLLGSRTEAMIDAAEGRNKRLAKEVAYQLMSELRAGARELPPTRGERFPIEGYQDFDAQFIVGEEFIMDHEANMMSMESDNDRVDRLQYQRERNDLRMARQKGMSYLDYQEQRMDDLYGADDDPENQVPSEDDYEDVLVVVYFPNVRISEDSSQPEVTYSLKTKVSTLALQGLTPEQAEALADSMGSGENENAADLSSSGSSNVGNDSGNSNSSGSQSGQEGKR